MARETWRDDRGGGMTREGGVSKQGRRDERGVTQRERDGVAREAWRDERIAAPPRQPLCDGLVEGAYEGLYNYVNRLRKYFI